jgi:hypothetical protein
VVDVLFSEEISNPNTTCSSACVSLVLYTPCIHHHSRPITHTTVSVAAHSTTNPETQNIENRSHTVIHQSSISYLISNFTTLVSPQNTCAVRLHQSPSQTVQYTVNSTACPSCTDSHTQSRTKRCGYLAVIHTHDVRGSRISISISTPPNPPQPVPTRGPDNPSTSQRALTASKRPQGPAICASARSVCASSSQGHLLGRAVLPEPTLRMYVLQATITRAVPGMQWATSMERAHR